MKLICATCKRLKDEEEFDWWFKSICVRKSECERKYFIRWMLKELEKQKRRKGM